MKNSLVIKQKLQNPDQITEEFCKNSLVIWFSDWNIKRYYITVRRHIQCILILHFGWILQKLDDQGFHINSSRISSYIRFSRMTQSTCPFRINWPDAKWQDFCRSKIDPIIFLPCQEFYSTSEFKFWHSVRYYDLGSQHCLTYQ